MRPYGVVMNMPGVDDSPCMGQADEPLLVQAFISEPPLKLSTKAFCAGFPGSRTRTYDARIVRLRKLL